MNLIFINSFGNVGRGRDKGLKSNCLNEGNLKDKSKKFVNGMLTSNV